MKVMGENIAEIEGCRVDYTIPLTEAVERDVITPSEYARRRANLVGEGTILEYILIPLLFGVWRRMFSAHAGNGHKGQS